MGTKEQKRLKVRAMEEKKEEEEMKTGQGSPAEPPLSLCPPECLILMAAHAPSATLPGSPCFAAPPQWQ